jgi:hypothetical protein
MPNTPAQDQAILRAAQAAVGRDAININPKIGVGVPTMAADFAGQIYVDTSTGFAYIGPVAGAATWRIAAANNSGSVAGRVGIPVLVDRTTLAAAASYAPAAFAAGTYRKLEFNIRADSGAATGITLALGSITGTLKLGSLYTESAFPTTPKAVGSSDWALGMGATPWDIDGYARIETGGIRKIVVHAVAPDGLGAGDMLTYREIGYAADTTHDVTSFSATFTGGTVTGVAELWGIPF